MKTNVYLRSRANNKWESLDLTEVTDAELSDWLKTLERDGLIKLAIHLVNRMKRNVEEEE
jgi:hypothetical protein